jgi:hypothetical protein
MRSLLQLHSSHELNEDIGWIGFLEIIRFIPDYFSRKAKQINRYRTKDFLKKSH